MNCLAKHTDEDESAAEQRVAQSRQVAERTNIYLRAFTVLNTEPYQSRPERPLDGLPIGVKDLYDTAGLETAYGSPIYAGNVPTKHAKLVQALCDLGAYIVGKTVTTEFAWRQAGPTVNPYGTDRTPGGSSSGSAAAVAAGILPLALGTQTFGSIIRPAAFCGIAGFKPSYGALSTEGIQPLSPSLDQAGYLAQTIKLIQYVHHLILEEPHREAEESSNRTLRFVRGPWWNEASETQRRIVEEVAEGLRVKDVTLIEAELPEAFEACHALAETILCYEAAETYRPHIDRHGELVSGHIQDLVRKGEALLPGDYERALTERDKLGELYRREMQDFDAILTLPALGEAPLSSEGTGNPGPCVPWTLMGVPATTLPYGFGDHGMPLGIQLVGKRDADFSLLGLSVAIEAMLEDKAHRKPVGPDLY